MISNYRSFDYCLKDVKVKWDGHDEKEVEVKDNNVRVQTEKTLAGYGKPLHQDEAPKAVKQPAKFRQAPANSAVKTSLIF